MHINFVLSFSRMLLKIRKSTSQHLPRQEKVFHWSRRAISNTLSSSLRKRVLLIKLVYKVKFVLLLFHFIQFLLLLQLHKTNMTTNNDQQYSEQLRVLQERFPQATTEKLTYLLKRFNGDADQVG